jgi:magnesium chelatase family protein
MLYETFGASAYATAANILPVEGDSSAIETDQDHFHTVGLPDVAVREP